MSLSILHQSCWAKSAGGRDIELWKSNHTSRSATKRPLLFIGGVHGDEPEGVKLAEEFLFWLQKNNNQSFLPWILIPCLNVDGFAIQERTNAHGVDLNRNFPSPDWSHEAKAPRYYPGPAAGSEPETQALIELIKNEKPLVIIHFHSWKPCVVYTGSPGKSWADDIAKDTSYESKEDIGYPTPGSLGQYGWLIHQTPVICIEEQDHLTNLDQIWPRFQSGLERILSREL